MNVFSLKNIVYSYAGSLPVLNNLNLDFTLGERAVILGANGTGKSTLLALLDGLVFPTDGSIHVFGRELSENALEDRAFSMDFRKRVAFVFQNPDVQLFSSTVRDEIAFGPLQLGYRPQEIETTVGRLLESLRITDIRDRAPHALSDGQKKKVAIASSLATDPEVLLLDEPTSSLDPVATESIEALVRTLTPQLTVIIVTHNLAQARRVADRTIFLNKGRLVEHGDTQQVFENPAEEETAHYVSGRFG